jgi:glycine dehydrogenase subunit 2
MLGREGMTRVAEFATLTANYLAAQLSKAGFTLAFSHIYCLIPQIIL